MASRHEFADTYTNTSDEEEDEDEEEQEQEQELEEEMVSNNKDCKDVISITCRPRGRVPLDPRSDWIRDWNRVFLLVCATGLFIDPLFFYTFSISESCMCVFIDGWFAVTVTVLRCVTDALHVWNMWLGLKMSRWWRSPHHHRGLSHDDDVARTTAARIITKAKKSFCFDLFVILPIPQVVLWVVIPALLKRGLTTEIMTVSLIMFLFQYLPKIYHSVCLLRRMQNLSGYIFGTVWWGIALNLIAYFVASHSWTRRGTEIAVNSSWNTGTEVVVDSSWNTETRRGTLEQKSPLESSWNRGRG